jgi:hypothetical protein
VRIVYIYATPLGDVLNFDFAAGLRTKEKVAQIRVHDDMPLRLLIGLGAGERQGHFCFQVCFRRGGSQLILGGGAARR